MKTSLIAAATLLGAFALSACDDRDNYRDREPPVEVETAPVDAPPPPPPEAAPSPNDTPPLADQGTLPPDTKSSEESVQPESETLFY